MPRIPQYDTRTDPEDYMPQQRDNYDSPDAYDNSDLPGRSVKTRTGKYPSRKGQLPMPAQGRSPSPTADDIDTGIGTDGAIQGGIDELWRTQMLRKLLGSALVPPHMTQVTGGGNPSDVPAESMEGNELGALFDPTPMAMQRRGRQY